MLCFGALLELIYKEGLDKFLFHKKISWSYILVLLKKNIRLLYLKKSYYAVLSLRQSN